MEFRNRVLRSLSPESLARLPLVPLRLDVGHEMELPGFPIANLFFLESGMASTTTTFLNGGQAEIAMSGIESIIGVSALVGTHRSLNRIYMQIAGAGFSCTLAAATAEFRRFDTFHDICLRSLQDQFVQAAQTAGCYARHNAQQRLARWLLFCANRTGSNSFQISQEAMASMIGNSRPTISVVASDFQTQGLIRYQRSHVTILDPARLEQSSCECFRVVIDYLDGNLDAGKSHPGASSYLISSHSATSHSASSHSAASYPGNLPLPVLTPTGLSPS